MQGLVSSVGCTVGVAYEVPTSEVNNTNPKNTESSTFTEILHSYTQTGIYYLNFVHA